jgi:hypothetical protein
MKNSIATIAVLVAAGTAMAGSAIQSNGGFELGDGPDSQDWTEFGGGAPGTVSERVFGNAASGDYAHHISAVGAVGMGAGAGISQNTAGFGLGTLVAGTSLQLSFDASADLGPGGVGFYVLRILNRSGAIVADTGLQGLSGAPGYQSYSSAALTVPDFGADPSDYYSAFVEIFVNAGAFDGSFASAYIDNVVITGTAVPAPGAMALLGLGGLMAGRRRR